MGKASSAKKIQRAARAGGRAKGVRDRHLAFPAAIGAIVLLGSGLVGLAWNDHRDDGKKEPPEANKDHWHAAVGIYVCDKFLEALPETHPADGVHTHGDGVIHIHPSSLEGSGDNATLGKFIEDADKEAKADGIEAGRIKLTDDELTVGDETWKNGESKCGDEEGELVVARWEQVQTTDKKPSLNTSGFSDLRFREDAEGYTIAFVPEGTTDIPKPESAAQLQELGAADDTSSGNTTTSSTPESTTTPAPPPEGTDPNATTTAPPAP